MSFCPLLRLSKVSVTNSTVFMSPESATRKDGISNTGIKALTSIKSKAMRKEVAEKGRPTKSNNASTPLRWGHNKIWYET